MKTTIATKDPDDNGNSLLVNIGDTQRYIAAATSDNTRSTYRSAIRQFEKWGGRLPADQAAIIRYLTDRAGELNPRTLDVHITAISQWHHYQGLHDPTHDPMVRKTLEGIRRVHGTPKRKAKALRLEHINTMLEYVRAQPETLKKRRDIALLLCGFFGAFRRSELVSIQVEDFIWEPEGLIIRLPRSKTDQEGAGLLRALPFGTNGVCPATALNAWLSAANISEGAVFRPVNRWDHVQEKSLNPGAINELLKTLAAACGFDFVDNISSHSFRRGFSTSAARERIDFELIKKQGNWKSDATVWEYIEEGQQLTNNASLILMEKMAGLTVKV
jgi:integrase